MATDINRIIILGRLTRDPDLKHTGSGTAYCRFGIANNRNFTVNGERREEVSFFNCVAWARQAEIINQYCRKGKQVAIDGRLKQNSWEGQDGKKQSAVDIVVESLQMLGSPGDGNESSSGVSMTGDDNYGRNSRPHSYDSQPAPDPDEDIPF